jgi:hypothetical protein
VGATSFSVEKAYKVGIDAELDRRAQDSAQVLRAMTVVSVRGQPRAP